MQTIMSSHFTLIGMFLANQTEKNECFVRGGKCAWGTKNGVVSLEKGLAGPQNIKHGEHTTPYLTLCIDVRRLRTPDLQSCEQMNVHSSNSPEVRKQTTSLYGQAKRAIIQQNNIQQQKGMNCPQATSCMSFQNKQHEVRKKRLS